MKTQKSKAINTKKINKSTAVVETPATAHLIFAHEYVRDNVFTMFISKDKKNVIKGTPLEFFKNKKLMNRLSRKELTHVAFMAGVECETSMARKVKALQTTGKILDTKEQVFHQPSSILRLPAQGVVS